MAKRTEEPAMRNYGVSVRGGGSEQRSRHRLAAILALALVASIGTGTPAAADAGPDLAFSRAGGPAGTEVELFSPDVFGMGADVCPGEIDPDNPYGPDDSFEVRWQLAVLAGPGTPLQPGGAGGYRYALATDPITEVLATGVVETRPDEPWRTTLTIPDDVAEGDALVAGASCWRTGADVPGGEQVHFDYFYLAVFVVTGPDGVVPAVPTSSTEPAGPQATASPGPGGTQPGPGSRPSVGVAPTATPRPGSATYTG